MSKLEELEGLENKLTEDPDEYYRLIRQLGPLLICRAKQAVLFQEALRNIIRKPTGGAASGMMKKIAHVALEKAESYRPANAVPVKGK